MCRSLTVKIMPSGAVCDQYGRLDERVKAVEVPTPHGRLADVDVLCEALIKRWNTADKNAERIIAEVMADVVTPIVASAPTIIEAEE